jgi:hypothetical protein
MKKGRTDEVAQVLEHLLRKCKAVSSTPRKAPKNLYFSFMKGDLRA